MSKASTSPNNAPAKGTGAAHSYAGLRVAALILLAILFVAVNMFASVSFRGARLDLTENDLFTLSDGTQDLLASLDEPITLRYFYSEGLAQDYPRFRGYGVRVRDLLEEMQAEADGQLKLEVIDPEPFSEEEDLAMSLGLQGARTADGEVIYFGLVGSNLVDGIETIPFFTDEREEYLEYDVARMIQTLSRPEKPTLGLVTSLPLDTGSGGLLAAMRGQSKPYIIYEELSQTFSMKFLEQDFDRVPSDVDVLMVAHPKPLDESTLYAIDQFVMRGGRMIAFFDPHSELSFSKDEQGERLRGSTTQSNLEPLFSAWGIDYDPNKVLVDRGLAQRVEAGFDARRQIVDYPLWLAVPPENMNQNDVVTADLDQLNLGTSGIIAPKDASKTVFLPLIWSSDDASVMTGEEVREGPRPDDLMRSFKPTGEVYTIAARVTGALASAFPEGAPKSPGASDDGSDANTPPQPPTPGMAPPQQSPQQSPQHLAETKEPANLILMADSDLLDDAFWVRTESFSGERIPQPIADNGSFVVSAVENLMGANGLISLRARERADRNFEVVEALRREAEADYLAQKENLESQIATTEEKLNELRTQARGREGDPETEAQINREMERFRAELLENRRKLRDVQANLRSNIEDLGSAVRFANVALMPILVALAALGVAFWRRRRRKRT